MRERALIPLHQNENYWLLTEEDAARYSASSINTYSCYPEYVQLREALGTYAGIDASHVLATSGSDAAIRALAEHDVRYAHKVLLPVPTFYGYERIFSQVGLSFTPVCYSKVDDSFIFPTEETIAHLASGKFDTVYLCQPNNPLGISIPESDLLRMLDTAKMYNVLTVVDEAYYEFTNMTVMNRVDTQPLVILRTLSKAFGLAGARVGYLIADDATVAGVQDTSLPWPIAHSSVNAALVGLERSRYFMERLALVVQERIVFGRELSEIAGLTVHTSETNFMLIDVPHASSVRESLEENGILVARGELMSAVPAAQVLLKDTLRVSTPSPEHRAIVVTAFKEALDK